jgi:hypothetical protein
VNPCPAKRLFQHGILQAAADQRHLIDGVGHLADQQVLIVVAGQGYEDLDRLDLDLL